VSSKPLQAQDLNRAVLDLVHAMILAGDLDRVLATLLDSCRALVRAHGSAVMWVAEEYLKVLASVGPTAALPGLMLPVSQMGAARPVVESGRCILIADTSIDKRWQRVPGEEKARSWLGIPLTYADRTVGLLEWTASEPRRFVEADVVVGSEIARHAAPILHSSMLLAEMRRRLRESAAGFRQPGEADEVNSISDLDAEMAALVVEAQESTGGRNAFAFALAEESGLMRCIAAAGEKRERLRDMVLQGDGSLDGWFWPPLQSDGRRGKHASDREVLTALRCPTMLVLPLTVRGQVRGMLGVAGRLPTGSFPADATRVMTHLASQASLLLERTSQVRQEPVRYDYGAIVESSPLGVGALTLTGEILFCNPGLADLLSRSSQTLTGRNLAEFLATGDRHRLSHVLEEVVLTQQRTQVDVRLRAAVGEQRHLRISLAPVRVSEGAGESIVAVVENVTSLKLLEQERVEHLSELREKNSQLRELDQLKSRFVANVSHELRTPLAVIKLFATLARKGRPEKQEHYLQTIEQETHRLEAMVENILDLTRMDKRALQVHAEWLDVEQTAAQVLEVYAEAARRRDIELKNDIRGPLPPIWADKNHLVQMLTNLVDNALKYTPRGGQVRMEAEVVAAATPRVVEIRVCDTGAGIPEDEQDKVFERFYRGSNNTPGSTGTGLGLAIVRELMAQHKGKVLLRSRVGEGSTFILQFPVYDPSSRPDLERDRSQGSKPTAAPQ
jgi:PAS domain S-box-containing protein